MVSIFRYNSGLPLNAPFDNNGWATNWNIRSRGLTVKTLQRWRPAAGLEAPNLFGDLTAAYQSLQPARGGNRGAQFAPLSWLCLARLWTL